MKPTMITRRRIFIFVLLAIVIAALAFWLMRSGEPRYQGKSLSEWLNFLQEASIKNYEDVPKANAAIRAIGSNAIPFLLDELQVKDSEWKGKMDDWLYKTFDWRRKSPKDIDRRGYAALGFQVLGKDAESAIPKIAELVGDSDVGIALNAVDALGLIESEKTVPLLASYLTNQNIPIRKEAALSFAFNGNKARRVIPALINGMNDAEPYMQMRCAWALRHCEEKDLAQVITALTNKLGDADLRVRGNVAQALGSFGTKAIAVLPALQQIYDNAPTDRRSRIATALLHIKCEMFQGGIIRGPTSEKRITFVFTGHEYAEGSESILRELSNHNGHASFFLTGAFYDNPAFKDLLQRMNREGHYLGAHSDRHTLYCSWEDRNKTLVTRDEFILDLENNINKVGSFRTNLDIREYFLPAFEYYNRDIVDWTRSMNRTLINYTPGTRSNADYTGEADKNFVSSQAIFDSIVKHEQEDPDGLNGFILLLHIGAGPNRADKFHNRFGELLDYLTAKGYQFVRVDELLEPKMDTNAIQRQFPNLNPNEPFRRR